MSEKSKQSVVTMIDQYEGKKEQKEMLSTLIDKLDDSSKIQKEISEYLFMLLEKEEFTLKTIFTKLQKKAQNTIDQQKRRIEKTLTIALDTETILANRKESAHKLLNLIHEITGQINSLSEGQLYILKEQANYVNEFTSSEPGVYGAQIVPVFKGYDYSWDNAKESINSLSQDLNNGNKYATEYIEAIDGAKNSLMIDPIMKDGRLIEYANTINTSYKNLCINTFSEDWKNNNTADISSDELEIRRKDLNPGYRDDFLVSVGLTPQSALTTKQIPKWGIKPIDDLANTHKAILDTYSIKNKEEANPAYQQLLGDIDIMIDAGLLTQNQQ